MVPSPEHGTSQTMWSQSTSSPSLVWREGKAWPGWETTARQGERNSTMLPYLCTIIHSVLVSTTDCVQIVAATCIGLTGHHTASRRVWSPVQGLHHLSSLAAGTGAHVQHAVPWLDVQTANWNHRHLPRWRWSGAGETHNTGAQVRFYHLLLAVDVARPVLLHQPPEDDGTREQC